MSGIHKIEYEKNTGKEHKEGVKEASELFLLLSKAIKACKIYPDTSPLRIRFIEEASNRFLRFLEEYGDLDLKVKQTELLYNGEVIYSLEPGEEGLSTKLYRDSIREIVFTEGLSSEELMDFMKIIIDIDNTNNESDDDLVTVLWEKEFKHIHYTVVEDIEGGEDVVSSPQNSTGGNKEALLRAHSTETGEVSRRHTVDLSTMESEIEGIYGKPFSEIFILTPEEIERLQNEMAMEEEKDLFLELVDILFHILQIEEDLTSYTEIIRNIGRAIKTLLFSGNYSKVIPIINILKTLQKEESNFSPAHALEAKKIIDSLGDREFLHELAISMNINRPDNSESLFTFLTLLNENAILSMATLTGTIEQMKIRRIFCDALALLARKDIDPLFTKIEDDNWYIVRNVVYVLGKIGDDRAVKYIKKIKGHREPQVRKEIIHTLAEINSGEAKEMIISYLEDPDSSVRMWALKNLAALDYEKASGKIWEIISSRGFDTKEVFEKKEFFETLGRLNSPSILPFLREMLMRRTRFFGKTRVGEYRIYAVLALKNMSIPGAIDILKEGAMSDDRGIKKLCEEALRDLDQKKNAGQNLRT